MRAAHFCSLPSFGIWSFEFGHGVSEGGFLGVADRELRRVAAQAAGALSIKIGKRPRDLLNPKAVKYMQSVFSIKDAISKKESCEISALFGVTVTQVREFFGSQRSRVRKLVRLSREKTIKSNASSEQHDGVPASSDPVPLNTIGPASVEETPSCSTNDDTLPGLDDLDKQFVENIFNLMRKEETFSGQVKLMEWILRIQNSAVLCWFLNKGGMMILATWLSQAAAEEQTSVLLVVLNVYISNRARVLLSKWSKLLARSEAMKKLNGVKSPGDAQQQLLLSEVMVDESWQSSIETTEMILDNSENFRTSETTQALKLLPASSDDSNKRHILGVSSSQIRERRKVQLVEQPGQKTAGRSPQATRAAPLNQSRPMSADDIQKAKMRAQFLQSKYKKASSSNENKMKTEGRKSSQVSILSSASKVPVRPSIEEHKKTVAVRTKAPNVLEASIDPNPKVDLKEPLWEKCRRVQISWHTPPEVKLNQSWRVSTGENSKEVEVQKNRNRREKETMYQTVQEIPSNPKEPWDLEMDYDDTLTPVIPIEQSPDIDAPDTQVTPNHGVNNAVTHVAPSQRANGSVSTSQVGNSSTAEPDLELLAVLLKNPELVFALTSGQAANLSSEETVKLLDMIKAGGAGCGRSFNRFNKQVEEKVEVSLPSPTPPSNPGTSGWRPEATRNPFSQVNRAVNNPLAASATINKLVLPQMSAPHVATPQLATIPSALPQYSLPLVPEKYTSLHHSSSTVQSNPPLDSDPPLHNLHSSLRVETASNVQPALVSTNTFNAEERHQIAIPPNPLVPTPAHPQTLQQSLQQQQQQRRRHEQLYSEPYMPTPAYSKEIGKPSQVPDSWRARQGTVPANYNPPLANQNHSYNSYNTYNASPFGGPVQPPQSQWEGNDSEYAEGDEFESWSPDNSPTRNREYYGMGRDFPETRMNPGGRAYRSDQLRMRNSSGYRDHNRHGNRRWRERRR
ncbi:hypothetical protein TIFTF001_007342 [Ficus carica]|uniref:Homeobox domain-containing protein n=1 Tax=Ficus carica TaxID=3494 RepID=A0AA88CZL2_FICCA|nr:hypothetical protein TIFTF001_007342 [Ficus carica]